MTRVLVCGDRDWHDRTAIRKYLLTVESGSTVIHGAQRGADRIAGEVADKLGLAVEAYPAQWTRFGRAAGPIRNKQMLVEGKPELVVFFHLNLAASHGTKNMVGQARRAGIRVLNGESVV